MQNVALSRFRVIMYIYRPVDLYVPVYVKFLYLIIEGTILGVLGSRTTSICFQPC